LRRGGETAAALYRLVGTCKHLEIDPLAYLLDLPPALFAPGDRSGEEGLAYWLPDAWHGRQEKVSATAAAESPGTAPG
jgi:hypothetical protein